ncbi:hypothetical protein [Gordonibacter massiliensis (ex Traore et al. 2017)]|uniref:hypothetical protein n=1 Tax=Gordonibacter massiliensis (ex Traore et al. 2017) TaxID=1841863 RepID=UPI001C8BE802|nr:hypothetical protein [Gordonibacter massiliensis (ex Traore et al. 2017)]MBX9032654.1 hypothetical protein [Gordonibacter massiliensis (ex Traore et al. 2017)]
MADKEMSGIERLRELAEDTTNAPLWSYLRYECCEKWGAKPLGVTFEATLRSIADQIEREREACSVDNLADSYDHMVEFRARVAGALGVPLEGDPATVHEAVFAELDKRLMPCDLTWPCWDDGSPITRDDAPEHVTAVALHLDGSGYGLLDAILEHAAGERVKRPEPEVLGADGLPIKDGETMYTLDGKPFVVEQIDRGVVWCVGGGWMPPEKLTHTQPDTQERIDEDATIDPATYCDSVLGWSSEKIVHLADYAAQNEAMIADLLRRQRELDARTMGGQQMKMDDLEKSAFDWDALRRNEFVVNCKTEEAAKDFCRAMHDHGMAWKGGDSYLNKEMYGIYRDRTCYTGTGMFAFDEYYTSNDRKIVEWKVGMGDERTAACVPTRRA